jgi:hypothetical protein
LPPGWNQSALSRRVERGIEQRRVCVLQGARGATRRAPRALTRRRACARTCACVHARVLLPLLSGGRSSGRRRSALRCVGACLCPRVAGASRRGLSRRGRETRGRCGRRAVFSTSKQRQVVNNQTAEGRRQARRR